MSIFQFQMPLLCQLLGQDIIPIYNRLNYKL